MMNGYHLYLGFRQQSPAFEVEELGVTGVTHLSATVASPDTEVVGPGPLLAGTLVQSTAAFFLLYKNKNNNETQTMMMQQHTCNNNNTLWTQERL